LSKIVDQLISGVIKGAMSEILKKTGVRQTRRTKRRAKASTSLGGGIVGSILKAALGEKKTRVAKKQVSKRRTAAARSRQR
jgi:hypothetical protein